LLPSSSILPPPVFPLSPYRHVSRSLDRLPEVEHHGWSLNGELMPRGIEGRGNSGWWGPQEQHLRTHLRTTTMHVELMAQGGRVAGGGRGGSRAIRGGDSGGEGLIQ